MSFNEKNEKITCRVAIQVCIGYFPDGRERHRTFSMKGVDPDAPVEAIAAVVRALAPLLVYPITKVRKIVKRVILIFEEDGMPVELAGRSGQSSQNDQEYSGQAETRKTIPFAVYMRPSARNRDIKRRRYALPGAAILPFPARMLRQQFALPPPGEETGKLWDWGAVKLLV